MTTPAPQNDFRERGIYEGKELKPNPGIPDSRFEAYRLPSVRGTWRIWPDGRKEKRDED
jgi:hypothetical protein